MVIILEGISAADKRFYDAISDRIRSLKFEDKEGMSLFSIEVENRDLALFDNKILLEGKELYAQWGVPGNVTRKRKIILTKITGFSILTISGVSSIFKHDLKPQHRLWKSKKLDEIAKAIASEMGYENPDIEALPPDWKPEDIQQYDTNARFLQRMADRVGYAFWVGPDNLHWRSRSVKGKPSLYLRWKGTVTDNRNWGDIKNEPELNIEFTRSKPHVVVIKAKKDPAQVCKLPSQLTAEEKMKIATEQEGKEKAAAKAAYDKRISEINNSNQTDAQKAEARKDAETDQFIADLKAKNKAFRIRAAAGKELQNSYIVQKDGSKQYVSGPKATEQQEAATAAEEAQKEEESRLKIVAAQGTGNIVIIEDKNKKRHIYAEGKKVEGPHMDVKHGPSGKPNFGYGNWKPGIVELKITIYGLAKVYLGQVCNLDGVGVYLNGKYYIRGVEHNVDSTGFTQTLIISRDSRKVNKPKEDKKINKCEYTLEDPGAKTGSNGKEKTNYKITTQETNNGVRTGNITVLRQKTKDGVTTSSTVPTPYKRQLSDPQFY